MDVPPERSRLLLHNFTLPRLKWGNQRFLRCMKLNNSNPNAVGEGSSSDGRSSASEAESDGFNRTVIKRRSSNAMDSSRKSSPLKPIVAADTDEDGIEAVLREKLRLDLRVAADGMKVSILEQKKKEKELDDSTSARPWNLRTRRAAACKAPPNESGGGGKAVNCSSSPPLRLESPTATVKSSRLRGLASAAAAATTTTKQSVEKGEKKSLRPNFSVSLSREEIVNDFMAMVGTKPPRRPKKRPKAIQNQLDSIFPGSWLTEVTPEAYEVPDNPEAGKG